MQILTILALIACTTAVVIKQSDYASNFHTHSHEINELEEKDEHPKYKFEYAVNDQSTGDHKTHWEERDGDVVKGEYTLQDADGTKRVVEYTADDQHGFMALVKKIGHALHLN